MSVAVVGVVVKSVNGALPSLLSREDRRSVRQECHVCQEELCVNRYKMATVNEDDEIARCNDVTTGDDGAC